MRITTEPAPGTSALASNCGLLLENELCGLQLGKLVVKYPQEGSHVKATGMSESSGWLACVRARVLLLAVCGAERCVTLVAMVTALQVWKGWPDLGGL